MKTNRIFLGLLLMTTISLVNCSKDEIEINQEKLVGAWISLDKTDTLDFVNKNSFYKNHDHFDYDLSNDSIEIRYRGVLYIGVPATKHKYSLNNNILTIDFTNKHCYGFSSQIRKFEKE